jgi:hypothetical protein
MGASHLTKETIMCLLIQATSAKIRDTLLNTQGLLADIYDSNSDGLGIMYAARGEVFVQKHLPQNAAEVRKIIDAMPDDDREVALHFRMRTHGLIDMENCHPYQINADAWLMHNGILHTGNKKDVEKSDTWHFARDYLETLDPDHLHNPQFVALLGEFIENNRFAILTSDGRMTIVNRHQGVEHDGIFFSNTYAWSPSMLIPGYAKRHVYSYKDFTHDLGAYKPYHYDSSWWPEDEDAEDEAGLADDVYAALDDYDEDALTKLLRDHAGTVVNLILNEFEITLYKNATDLDHATQAVVDAWIGYDDAYLVAKAEKNPSFVAQALLYNCDFEWCGVETPSR